MESLCVLSNLPAPYKQGSFLPIGSYDDVIDWLSWKQPGVSGTINEHKSMRLKGQCDDMYCLCYVVLKPSNACYNYKWFVLMFTIISYS